MLPRYVGLYSVTNGNAPPLTFVCMTNAFGGVREVHARYDLKGSTHGRRASARELTKSAPVRKDLDWREHALTLPMGDEELQVLRADAAFLASKRLLDYSLLVGVHLLGMGATTGGEEAKPPSRLPGERTPGLMVLEDARCVCYVAVVDILTVYTCRKALETFFTGTLPGCRDVSCQPPPKYASRFGDFLASVARKDRVDSMADAVERQWVAMEQSAMWRQGAERV